MDVIFKLKLHLSREHIYWIISETEQHQYNENCWEQVQSEFWLHIWKEIQGTRKLPVYSAASVLIDSYFFQSFGEKSYFLLRENPNYFSFLSNYLHVELSSETINSHHCTVVTLLEKQNC